LTNRNTLPIGLDIGHGWIKMVQLVRGEQLSVRAAQKARIDEEPADDLQQYRQMIISTVKQMLARGRFQGANVVTALANEKLEITSLRLAQMSDGETGRAVMEEARGRFSLSSSQDVIRYLPVGQVRQGDELKNEFVLLAADGQVVREHIQMLEQAGLVSVGLDAIPCALFRSVDRLFRREEDWQQTMVFVDVGKCYTTVVFGRGGEMAFVKEIPIGTQRFDEEIADKLGITVSEAQMLRAALRAERMAGEESRPDSSDGGTATAVQSTLDVSTRQVIVDAIGTISQELAREISLCFRYYTVTFRGKRVERAVFAGGGTYENILLNVLRRQLTVEVEIAEPFRGLNMTGVNLKSDRRGGLCEWTVAVGLALKGLAE
jgi:type IV pilus assembly protein PilM